MREVLKGFKEIFLVSVSTWSCLSTKGYTILNNAVIGVWTEACASATKFTSENHLTQNGIYSPSAMVNVDQINIVGTQERIRISVRVRVRVRTTC